MPEFPVLFILLIAFLLFMALRSTSRAFKEEGSWRKRVVNAPLVDALRKEGKLLNVDAVALKKRKPPSRGALRTYDLAYARANQGGASGMTKPATIAMAALVAHQLAVADDDFALFSSRHPEFLGARRHLADLPLLLRRSRRDRFGSLCRQRHGGGWFRHVRLRL